MHSAAQLAGAGFRVFPLRRSNDHAEAKRPCDVGWQAFATSDVEVVERRFEGQYSGCGIGVLTGNGLLVVDVDRKHGRDGGMSLFELEMDMGALPATREAATPTGGRHLYFSIPPDCNIHNAVDRMPGVDWRGEGGYVVGPGSVLPGGAYRWVDPEVPIAALPEAWTAFMRVRSIRPGLNGSGSGLVLSEPDTPFGVERAIRYLRDEAPTAVEGVRGDATTFAVCCRVVRDFAISGGLALSLISEHWNWAGSAVPPWDLGDLAAKIDSALKSGHGPIGGGLGTVEFGDATAEPGWADKSSGIDPPSMQNGKRGRLFYVPFTEAADRALTDSSEPLIEGLLDQGAMAVLYGASNSGKTFVALDMAFHIGTGRPWQGRPAAGGSAVYVAAEGGRGIFKRVAALRARYGADAAIAVVPCPINLREGQADVPALIALVREAEARFGQPARMVVIDTLSRALAGGEENGSVDMGAFVRNVDRVREAARAAMLIVHHTGKDAARGARGHSLLQAATDTEIEIVDSTIKVTKQRDMEAIADMRFRLEPVDLGADLRGRRVRSCTIAVDTGSEFMRVELTGAARDMFEAFMDVAKQQAMERDALADWRVETVSTDKWEAQFITNMEESKSGNRDQNARQKLGTTPRTMRRSRQVVADSGHLKKCGEDQWVMV